MESSRVILLLNIEGGRLFENGKDIPWGTSELLGMALDQGTKNKTPEQLENEMERLGASISFSPFNTGFNIYVSCEKDNLTKTVDLLKEMLYEPRWDEKEFKKGRKRMIQGAKSGLNNRSVGLSNVWNRLKYNESALGKYVGADEIANVEISHVKSYYENFFHPAITKAIMVGPLSDQEMVASLKFLESWNVTKSVPSINKPELAPAFLTSQIFGVEYVDADQSDIIMGFRTIPYDFEGDFYKSNIMNFALGGNFNSRLNLKIREEKGWTYGIRGGFSPSYKDLPGYYTISAGVKAAATDSAIIEIMSILKEFKEKGLSDEEFEFTKKALLSSEALDYESLNQKAGFISNIINRNLPKDYPQRQTQILKSITKNELNELARKNIDLDRLIVVVSGDMLLLKKRLNKIGLGDIQVLQKDGRGKVNYLKAGKTPWSKKK
jgi:zinc protease